MTNSTAKRSSSGCIPVFANSAMHSSATWDHWTLYGVGLCSEKLLGCLAYFESFLGELCRRLGLGNAERFKRNGLACPCRLPAQLPVRKLADIFARQGSAFVENLIDGRDLFTGEPRQIGRASRNKAMLWKPEVDTLDHIERSVSLHRLQYPVDACGARPVRLLDVCVFREGVAVTQVRSDVREEQNLVKFDRPKPGVSVTTVADVDYQFLKLFVGFCHARMPFWEGLCGLVPTAIINGFREFVKSLLRNCFRVFAVGGCDGC